MTAGRRPPGRRPPASVPPRDPPGHEEPAMEELMALNLNHLTPDQQLELFMSRDHELAALLRLPDACARAGHLRTCSFDERQRLYMGLISMAFLMAKNGHFPESQAMARHAMQLVEVEPADALRSYLDHSTPRNRGDRLAQIGQIHEQAGELGAALAAYLEADACYERDARLKAEHGDASISRVDEVFGGTNFRSDLYHRLFRLYQRLGDKTRAEHCYFGALLFRKPGSAPRDRLWELLQQGDIAFSKAQFDQALHHFHCALDAASECRARTLSVFEVLEALNRLSYTYLALGLYRRALEHAERSLAINRQAGYERNQQVDLRIIASARLGLGDRDGALEALRESLRCCTVPAPPSSDAALDWRFGEERRRFVRLEPAIKVLLEAARASCAHDPEQARAHLLAAATLVERLRGRIFSADARIGFQRTSDEVFDELIDLTYTELRRTQQPRLAEALFSAIERAKSRVLVEAIADQRLPLPDVDPALLAVEGDLLERERALEVELQSGAASTSLAAELDAVREELGRTWDRIAGASARGAEYVRLRRGKIPEVSELRALVSKHAPRVAVVNYYVTARRLIAVILASDRESLEVVAKDVGRAELGELVAVNREDPPPLDQRLPYWMMDLPPLVIDPIREHVAGYPAIALIPHDVLHGLPLQALATRTSAALLETAAISFAPSASVLQLCLERRPAANGPALVIGAPDRPDELPLPHAAEEAVAVAAIVGGEARLGPRARKDAFLEGAGSARSIHLACHHRFDPADPLASSLLLADGDLSARELLSVEIAPDLVVVSACQSGVSGHRPGDELVGVVRALLVAGAPTIVVSLWNAYDAVTAQLMHDFYRRRISQRQPKAAALCAAQRELRDRSLAEWAPFVLIGAWN